MLCVRARAGCVGVGNLLETFILGVGALTSGCAVEGVGPQRCGLCLQTFGCSSKPGWCCSLEQKLFLRDFTASPNPTGSPSGRSRTPRVQATVNYCLTCSTKDFRFLCVRRIISGLSINLTLIPARAAHIIRARSILAQSSVAASQRFECPGKGRGAVWSRQQASTSQQSSLWAAIQSGDGPGGKNRPYLPRFLLLEIVFAHCPYDATSPISRACRAIYHAGRIGFGCEGLQNQNGRSHPSKKSPLTRGAVYANISSGECPTAHCAPPAFGGLVSNWQPWQPAPLLSKRWTQPSTRIPCGIGLRPRQPRRPPRREPKRRCSSGAPSKGNTGWNSRDFSTASSEPWARFAALRQLFLSIFGIQPRLSHST